MAYSVKLVFQKHKRRKDGTAPVYVRIIIDRKPRYVATGVRVTEKQWNATREEVRKSHPNAVALNAKLQAAKIEAETSALHAPTADAAKAALTGTGGTLTDFFEAFAERLQADGKFWEHKKYRVTLGKLRAALGQTVDWKAVDADALRRFERYLRVERENNPNTVRKELTRLRRIYRQAVMDGVVSAADDPFLTYRQPKGQAVERRKLTREEVAQMEALELESGSALELARDAFVFAFYIAGMRFGDVCRLKGDDVDHGKGRVRYRMMKTGSLVDQKAPEAALVIAKRWAEQSRDGFVFPFLVAGHEASAVRLRRKISSCNVVVNRDVKRVARLSGIRKPDEVTFHVARHSFASFANKASGGNVHAVSKSLRHKSTSQTETYLKQLDQEAVDDLADDLWK